MGFSVDKMHGAQFDISILHGAASLQKKKNNNNKTPPQPRKTLFNVSNTNQQYGMKL